MTPNQLKYLEIGELKRNNLVTEGETKRSNLAREGETSRSNLVRERQQDEANKEIHRHNLIGESQNDRSIKETKRSNKAKERNTIKAAKIGSKAQRYSSKQSSAASRYSADKSADASKYSADSNRAAARYTADSNLKGVKYTGDISRINTNTRAIMDWKINEANVVSKEKIAKWNNDVQKYVADVNATLKSKEISQRDKASVRDYKAKLIGAQKDLAVAEASNNSREKIAAWKTIQSLVSNSDILSIVKKGARR